MIDLKTITALFEEIEERRKKDEEKRVETLAQVFEEFGESHIAKIIRERGIPKVAYIHTTHQDLIKAFRLICEVTEASYLGSSPEVISLSWMKVGQVHSLCLSKNMYELTGIKRKHQTPAK